MLSVQTIGRGIGYVDLRFQGDPQVIATAILDLPGGVALVDPGPSTCLAALGAGLDARGASVGEIEAILLTHIHLDHAGATGPLVRANPRIQVYVHERGTPHVVDPARLIDSARRLYGEDMDRLWGEIAPVPAANVRSLKGGEALALGDHRLEVAYTPGHASHHVCYFHRAARLAFVGDVAGVRIGPQSPVLAPTPPPDIDLVAWRASLAAVRAWRPETLFVTHFGPHVDAERHLRLVEQELGEAARLVRETLEQSDAAGDEARMAAFSREMSRRLRRSLSDADARHYEHAAPFWQCWLGLARYWRKSAAASRNHHGAREL